MSADRPLAEIMADIERQARNYGTVVLPTDDAIRLGAVAKAAVEMRSFIAYDTSDMDPGDTLGWNEMIRAFDAAANDAGETR